MARTRFDTYQAYSHRETTEGDLLHPSRESIDKVVGVELGK